MDCIQRYISELSEFEVKLGQFLWLRQLKLRCTLCVVKATTIPYRMLINKAIIICRSEAHLGTVEAKIILALKDFPGLSKNLSKSDHGS